MKCKNCKNLYNLSDENDVIIGKWCPKLNGIPDMEIDTECYYFKPQTNADRIRNMTDEELAEVLRNPCAERASEEMCDSQQSCRSCLLEWLQAEVKEGDT